MRAPDGAVGFYRDPARDLVRFGLGDQAVEAARWNGTAWVTDWFVCDLALLHPSLLTEVTLADADAATIGRATLPARTA